MQFNKHARAPPERVRRDIRGIRSQGRLGGPSKNREFVVRGRGYSCNPQETRQRLIMLKDGKWRGSGCRNRKHRRNNIDLVVDADSVKRKTSKPSNQEDSPERRAGGWVTGNSRVSVQYRPAYKKHYFRLRLKTLSRATA